VFCFGGGNFRGVHHGDERGGFEVDGGDEGFGDEGEVLGPGGGDFGKFRDGGRSDQGSDGKGVGADGEVGGGHLESIDVVSGVVDSLDETVGIHVLVTSASHAENVSGFGSGRIVVLVTETELTELILSVELAGAGVDGSGDG